MFKLIEGIAVLMRKLLFLLLIGFAVPANAAPIYLRCQGTGQGITATFDVTINPDSETGMVSELEKTGAIIRTQKLSQFISNTTYTLQHLEVWPTATWNSTYEINRVTGDFVHKYFATDVKYVSPPPPHIYRGKCNKKQPVKTMF